MDSFWNAFWLFLGVVAGALIQFILNWIGQKMQRRNAKRVFRVETSINRTTLDLLKSSLARKKERFVAGQVSDSDFQIDMSSFNYRIIDPLINAGYFHDFLGPEGVQRYMRYASELNINNAQSLSELLRREHEQGRSLAFLDWIIDTKLPEWEGHLSFVEGKLGGKVEVKRIEYTVPKSNKNAGG